MAETVAILVLSFLTAGFGSIGGLGGAVLLVPLLVVSGTPVAEAAPLGLVSVATGSLAAGARQLAEQLVHHRLGVVTELAASSGAVAGALAAGAVTDRVLTRVLAVVALAAAFAGGRRTGLRNPPVEGLGPELVGEHRGTLAGAYAVGGGVAPYRARRLPIGLAAMAGAGLIAGVAGVSGGFVKTPVTSELMHVPSKVAGATTTFTIGITAATALAVYAARGAIDLALVPAVVVGAGLGGATGSAVQARLSPPLVRRVLSVLLVAVALILAVRG